MAFEFGYIFIFFIHIINDLRFFNASGVHIYVGSHSHSNVLRIWFRFNKMREKEEEEDFDDDDFLVFLIFKIHKHTKLLMMMIMVIITIDIIKTSFVVELWSEYYSNGFHIFFIFPIPLYMRVFNILMILLAKN